MSMVSSTRIRSVFIRIGEGEGEHPLLLQVGLVDPGERTHDDRPGAHVAGFHGGVLTRGTLSVVLVADGDPFDPRFLVALREIWQGDDGVIPHVDTLTRLRERESVVGCDEEVAGDVREMAAVPQPRARRGDVVGRALARGLEEHREAGDVAAVPGCERLEQLEPVGARLHDHLDRRRIVGRGLEPRLAGIESLRGKLVGDRGDQALTEVDVETTGEPRTRRRSRETR